jgi:hypothetical protein
MPDYQYESGWMMNNTFAVVSPVENISLSVEGDFFHMKIGDVGA